MSSNRALAESLNLCVDPKDPLVNKLLRALATSAMSEVCALVGFSLCQDDCGDVLSPTAGLKFRERL